MTDPPPGLVARGVPLNAPEPRGPGTVVALAQETGRYTRFYVDLQSLCFRLPPGSEVRWLVGSDVADARNQACEQFTGDWVWFIDDDHAFLPNVLTGLLDRNVDIVTPLCLRRVDPFLPIPAKDGGFLDLTQLGPHSLVEVEHAGSSGMLIRRRVLERMEPPWFDLAYLDDGTRVSEDVAFCMRARQAGFKIHVDCVRRLGHISTAVVWPVWSEEESRWLTGFTVADGKQLVTEPGLPDSVAASG